MKDYSKAKIYCIRSNQTDKIYIGSTIHSLTIRFSEHKRFYNLHKNGKRKYVAKSYELLNYDDCYIELIKFYPCNCKSELEYEEGKYIRNWECVNKIIPGRTLKEYRNDNKEQISEQKKQYYNDNKDKILERQKQYYNDNKEQILEQRKQRITCECGSSIIKHSAKKHIKSKKHINWVNNNI